MTTSLDASIERAVAGWPVVGLGCSVIAEGETLLSRGFGTRRLGADEPVDERTLFAIGSVSKSFTGAAVAMLVDEGLISWDSRVIDHLRSFRLFDSWVTREMTVRDLLTHRSGLERGDFMWYKSGYDAGEVMRRVAHLQPSWSFRTTFGYQNIMYLAAGELITALTGKSWDDFISERILGPLGMSDSHASRATMDLKGNVAQPHAHVDGELVHIESHEGFNMNPAGSIYSSARDMQAWLRLAINGGTFKGKRLLSSGASRMTHTPQMLIAQSAWSELFPEGEFLTYAAGWFVLSYRGLTVITHGGNIDGMSAVAAVVPERRFGITALANVNSCRLPQALVYHAIDSVIFDRPKTWLTDFREREVFGRERLDYAEEERKRSTIAGTKPSRPLEAYAGSYADEFYGTARVALRDGRLFFSFIGFEGALEHWLFDSFTLNIDDPYLRTYKSVVRFDLDDFGEPSGLTLVVLGGLRMRLQFKRPDPPAVDVPIETLRALEGRYVSKLASVEIAIDAVGDALKVTVPGSIAGSSEDFVVRALIPIGDNRLAIASTQAVLAAGEGAAFVLEVPHQLPVTLTRVK
ncbi:MAG TPA: serine hydrolase [Candidatus Baltobacteraceae bacterium]|jgi:CubicO group peptidase (beta-lactamase class C family)|nr:serine hydrolase [Candidatus Baltobacteraceae bacterium]